MLNDPAAVGSKEYNRVLALGGELPIEVGYDVVGAVGVSGSAGKDDGCSEAGTGDRHFLARRSALGCSDVRRRPLRNARRVPRW